MPPPFDAESPYLGQLTDLVSRAVEIDARIRALQAARSVVFAAAHDLAEQEGTRDTSGSREASHEVSFEPAPTSRIPRGLVARRDRAHRVIRAELAAALHLSEWTIGSDIAHAVDALTYFPTLHAAQARGEVTEKHVRGAIDAGRIISHHTSIHAGSTLVDDTGTLLQTDAAEAEIARRYAWYDKALLSRAQSLTPALLAPVAKRLAEKVAGATFDDRHRLANRDRRVTLTDLDDGMCQLTALVTSLEGHAIFDRLTQYGKHLQAGDLPDSTQAGTPGVGLGVSVDAGTDTSADSSASTGAGTAVAEAFKRPLGEARADSLVSLLLEGELTDLDDAPCSGLGRNLRGNSGSGSRKRLGPRVTARVQVLVPISHTGRIDTSPSSGVGRDTLASSDGTFQPELVGVGPLDTDTATRIMHDTPTWDMIVVTGNTGADCPSRSTTTDGIGSGIDTTGDILTVDGYRVPAHLRRYLAARDEHCRFPGCPLPVYRCDIDHTIAAEDGGPTASNNLGTLCRGHHTMKHHGGLHPTQNTHGDFTWTLPSGRQYVTKPPGTVTFTTTLERPNIPSLMNENLQQHPFGMTDWDDPPETVRTITDPAGDASRPRHGQGNRRQSMPPGTGPPPF